MKPCAKLFFGHGYLPALLCCLLLAACGQTGELYMPQKHAIPPPPPRASKTGKKPQQPADKTTAAPMEKAGKRN